MNGAHDLGGMHGFGPVEIERDEPVFHSDWERKAFALNLAAGFLGKWNIDMSRFAREQMPPAEYLATSYYEHWAFGLEKLLHDHGLVTKDEVEARLHGRAQPLKSVPGARIPALGSQPVQYEKTIRPSTPRTKLGVPRMSVATSTPLRSIAEPRRAQPTQAPATTPSDVPIAMAGKMSSTLLSSRSPMMLQTGCR